MEGRFRFGQVCRRAPRWPLPTLAVLLLAVGWAAPVDAVTCTWSGGNDNWDNPSAWLGCNGGSGSTPDTPGVGDVAVVSNGTVNIFFPEAVDTLQMSGGVLFIDSGMGGSIDVLVGFDWSAGVIDGFVGAVNLQSGSVSNWTGADKTLRLSNIINIDGTVNWTAGLIHLEDAVIRVNSTGVWNWDFNGPVEYIDITAGFFGQIVNDGLIVKTGTSPAEIRFPVSLDGAGSVNVNAGSLLLGGNSNSDNNFNVSAGTTLFMTDATMIFSASSSFSGAGNVEFGRPADPPGCVVTINGGFTVTGIVRVEACDVGFGNAALTFVDLEMLDPAAVLGGPAVMDVTGSFTWNAGLLLGAPAETLTIGGAASATLAGLAGPPSRGIEGRELINNGLMTATAGNGISLELGAVLRNGPTGTLDFNMPSVDIFSIIDDGNGNQVFNEGNLNLTAAQRIVIEPAFANSGTVQVMMGQVDLVGDGTDSGNYMVNASGILSMSTGSRTVQSGSNFTGAGRLEVRDGAVLGFDGLFSLPELTVSGPAPAQMNYNSLGNLALTRLAILDASTLSTAGPIQVSVMGTLSDGTLRGIGALSLFVSPGASISLPTAFGSLFTFDNIAFVLAGSAVWQGGGIHLDNATQFIIQSSGVLTIDSNTMSPQILGCSICGSPELSNQGQLIKQAIGTGDDAQINAPINFFNAGSLMINGGDVQFAQFTQSGATSSTQVQSGASLSLGGLGNITAGSLSGTGFINGNVSLGNAMIAPGISGTGLLTINGNYTQGAGASMEMELGGNTPGTYDQLIVSGTATLGGAIDVLQFGGFVPSPADVFSLIQASSVVGTLTQGVNDFPSFELQFTPTEVLFAEGAVTGGTFVVTSTADPGDGVCDIAGTGDGCTLREAIEAANANPGLDVIEFAIPSAGVQTISPLTPLPAITEDLIMNGYSQPGAVPNTVGPADGGLNGTLLIELSGQNTTGDGLVVDAPGAIVNIDGLVINRWSGAGVRINSGLQTGVGLGGNYIGTSADGLSVPTPAQGTGVLAAGAGPADAIAIGNNSPAQRNLISGNADHGLVISTSFVGVFGNLIGTDVTGLAPLGNGRKGIFLSSDGNASSNLIGSNQPEWRNIIGANGEDGIGLQCAPVGQDVCFDGTFIEGNYIGVGVDGNTPLPNANGIRVIEMTYGRVSVGSLAAGAANKIYFNLGSGVVTEMFPVAGDEFEEGQMAILRNGFLGNGFMAIDLGADGPTPNDPGDADGGFNNGQNFPEITAFLPDTPSAGQTTVEYRVDSLPANSSYPLRIEFYRAAGNGGQEFLGADNYLLAEAGLTASYVLPGAPIFQPEDMIIATASGDNAGKEKIKTSEFTFYPVAVQITDDVPDPSTLGDPYTVEVSMVAEGPFQPVGNVLVDDGDTQSCMFSLLVSDNGLGSCVLASPAATGIYTLGAAFDGVANAFGFAIDPDGEPHTVNNPTVTTIVSDLPDPSGVGDPYIVQVDVMAAVGVPTGTIDISSTGGESCAFALVNGSGSCTVNGLSTGVRTLTATYNPDPGFDSSGATEDHTVVLANSVSTILSALPDPSAPGDPVTVMVEVTPAVMGNVLIPSGSVTVSANTGENCSIASLDGSGMGSCAIVFNTVGLRDITATYAGDGSFNGAVSVVEPHEVTNLPPEATTTTILSTVPSPSVVGQTYQVNVQVVGALGNTPCGVVLLRQLPDASSCNAVLAAGATSGIAVGSCLLAAPNAITKAITGSYQPAGCNFAASSAPLFTHPVNRASTTTTITGQSPNPSNVGQPVLVSFAVAVAAPGAGTPTGTVTVTDGIDVCQATLPATSCQLSFKTQGTRNLIVNYGGDPDFNGSATAGTQQVGTGGTGADLALRKFNDRCVLPGGTRISYQIAVSNLGPEAVTGARVTDTLPAGLTNASWTCSAGTGASCAAGGNGNIDQLVNLASGASLTFVLSADVQIAPEIVVNNTATITAPAGIFDPQQGNNTSTDSDPIGVFCSGMEAPLSD